MKKITVMLLIGAMVMSMIGCANESSSTKESEVSQKDTQSDVEVDNSEEVVEEREPVTLRIVKYESPRPDDALVSEYISELPQVKELNVTIEIVHTDASYYEQLPLMLASDEQIDIVFDARSGGLFLNNVAKSAYYDISEFVEEDAEFKEYIGKTLWDVVTVEGGIYGVPTLKDTAVQFALFGDKAIFDKHGISTEDVSNFEDMEKVLETVAQDEEYWPLSFQPWTWSQVLWMYMGTEVNYFCDYNYLAMRFDEAKTVLNTFETEEFMEFAVKMKSWLEKGYIHEQSMISGDENVICNGLKPALRTVGYAPACEGILATAYGTEEMISFFPSAPIATSGSAGGAIYCVTQKCENPERAYEFLRLWNTDADVKNAIAYGIPDRHYTLIDGQVKYVEGSGDMYSQSMWSTGNNLIAYTLVGDPVDKWEIYEDWNKSSIASPDIGFTLAITGLEDEMAAVNAVMSEYLIPIVCGHSQDVEADVATLNKMLKEAGIDTIIAEAQKQFDAFLAAK